MAALLISCLSLTALPFMADAMRVDTYEILNSSRNEEAVSIVSKFSFKLKATPCAALDFGKMKGIVQEYPKSLKRMQAQGTKWSNVYNCRLCDLEGNEENLLNPVMSGVVVKCHAYSENMRDNLEFACHAGNGKPGWRMDNGEIGFNNICVPCPQECEQCAKPGVSDILNAGKFKCILPVVENPTPVSHPWKCSAVQDRRKNPGKFQWCNYRKDLAKSSTNGYDPEPSSSWELAITAARCDKTEYDANEQISAMIKALTPKLNKLSFENCELCRIMAGGSKASESGKEVVIGESSSEAWVNTRCAFDELGLMACRADRGVTGWGRVSKCAPCPYECATCEDSTEVFGNTKKFKCNLRIPDGAGDGLAGIMLGKFANVPISDIATPDGYDCEPPKQKKCQTGKGVCIGGYKTHCKYKTYSY